MNKQVYSQIKSFERGDYVKVSWFDASDARAPLVDHKKPEILVDEWGVFLGVEGLPKHLLIGKHYVRGDRTWEATRIPLTLIQDVELVAKRASHAVSLRRYTIQPPNERVVRLKFDE